MLFFSFSANTQIIVAGFVTNADTKKGISAKIKIKNITTKVWRSTNPSNVVKAAYKGLNSMVDIKNELELRTSTKNNNIHSIKEPVSDE